MKTNGRSLIIISVCLLLAFLGCHRTQPPPDYANQPNCQLKRAQLGFLYNFNNPQPEVLKAEPNYPAEKADIRPGDIFVSINQSPVNTRGDFRAIMETIKTETPTSIVVKRNSEHITKTVVPKIVGESYTINAIDKIFLQENKKVNLIIVVNEITNTYGPHPNYTQLEEWKKAMAVQSRSEVEVGLIRRYQNQPNFSIVARENTDKLLQELRIQQSGFVTELIKTGKILGATHLLIIDFNRSQAVDRNFLDRTSRRLIEIETAKTIATESCENSFSPKN